MSEYASAISLAERLISKKGRLGYVRSIVRAASDPDKPWEPEEQSTTDAPVKLVEVALEQKFVDGSNIVSTDGQLLISAVSVPNGIKDTDSIIDRQQIKRIRKIVPLQPGEEPVLYTVIVRG